MPTTNDVAVGLAKREFESAKTALAASQAALLKLHKELQEAKYQVELAEQKVLEAMIKLERCLPPQQKATFR